MKNTRNDIETLAAAQVPPIELSGAGIGNDENAIEAIATAAAVALTYEGNDDNKLEALDALLV